MCFESQSDLLCVMVFHDCGWLLLKWTENKPWRQTYPSRTVVYFYRNSGGTEWSCSYKCLTISMMIGIIMKKVRFKQLHTAIELRRDLFQCNLLCFYSLPFNIELPCNTKYKIFFYSNIYTFKRKIFTISR